MSVPNSIALAFVVLASACSPMRRDALRPVAPVPDPIARPGATLAVATLAYGPDDALNAVDVYGVEPGAHRPLVVFVHGGGWTTGDKGSAAGAKPPFFVGEGFAFASTNYRLRPGATIEQGAQDIADSIAFLRSRSAELGIDPDQIILQGHSAGAHLAALTYLDPVYFEQAGVPRTAVKAISLLDGAGYDVARQVEAGANRETYLAVFGAEEADWARLSPLTHARRATSPAPFVIHHIEGREDSKVQSEALAGALKAQGGRASVDSAQDKTHESLNKEFGLAGDVPTTEVLAFVRPLVTPGAPGGLPAGTLRAPGALAEVREACAADAQRLCPGMRGTSAAACLSQETSTSAECRSALSAAEAALGARREGTSAAGELLRACAPDVARLCAGMTGRDAAACLRSHRDRLSEACRAAAANR